MSNEYLDIAMGKVIKQEVNAVLDRIKAEVEQVEINGYIRDVECFNAGINTVLKIIDKYKVDNASKENKGNE